MEDTPLRLCRIVTVPQTFQGLLREQLRWIVENDIDLTLVSSPGQQFEQVLQGVKAKAERIVMARRIAPLADFLALFKFLKFLSRSGFDIVHTSTPKAGFLGAVAGALAKIPIRIHTFTGQPWVELTGLKRRIPRECDRIIGKLVTHCYADSPSQREFLVSEGLVQPDKISVLGAGSISGVDLERFSARRWGGNIAQQTRRELGIGACATVITFVGRVTKDKGIVELVTAFETMAEQDSNLYLLLVGPFEPDLDPLPREILHRLRAHKRICIVGFSATPEKFLAAADIFCLPSYREGFGSVVIEAAALGVPAVVTRVTGLVDAVVDGVTGLVVPPKNVSSLVQALQTLIRERQLRCALGCAAKQRAIKDFDSKLINQLVVTEYLRLGQGRRLRLNPRQRFDLSKLK